MHETVSLEIAFPYWTAYRATLQILVRSPLAVAFACVFPVMGLVLIYLWVTGHHFVNVYDIVLLLVCFGFTPLITAFSLYSARRRNPLSAGPFKYVFDNSGIHASSAAFENTIRWNALRKVVETTEFILFYFAPSNAIAMPKPQLEASGALDAVREITRNNFQVQ